MGRAKNDFVRRYQVCMILVRTWHELSTNSNALKSPMLK